MPSRRQNEAAAALGICSGIRVGRGSVPPGSDAEVRRGEIPHGGGGDGEPQDQHQQGGPAAPGDIEDQAGQGQALGRGGAAPPGEPQADGGGENEEG